MPVPKHEAGHHNHTQQQMSGVIDIAWTTAATDRRESSSMGEAMQR